MEEICECDGHTVHKLSQRRLTADWPAPRDSDYSRMHSKVSSDWLPRYSKATWPVLEILKKAGYFPDSLVTYALLLAEIIYKTKIRTVETFRAPQLSKLAVALDINCGMLVQ